MSMVIANRYARALSEALGAEGRFRPTLAELEDFRAVYEESDELSQVLETPALALADKLRVLDAVMARLGTSQTTSNFLRVLLKNYRMNLLAEAAEAFRKIADAQDGVIRVQVLSATALTPAEQDAFRQRFERLSGKKAECEFKLDPSLLGGVVAQAGSIIYDGSVRGQLERMRRQLLEA
jgi:F-type H+-transporting ATPase subunit delta